MFAVAINLVSEGDIESEVMKWCNICPEKWKNWLFIRATFMVLTEI